MKRPLLLLILALLPALVAADCAPAAAATRPKPKAPTLAFRVAGTDLWVIWKASVSGADSVQVTAAVTGQPSQTKGFTGSTKTDSAKFVRPAQGTTVTISVTAVAFKGGQKGSSSAARTLTYKEPVVVPVPTVDSIWAWPASFTVEATRPGVAPLAKNQQQLCAFVGFHGGHVGFRRPAEGALSVCDNAYRALPAMVRAVSAVEQAAADGVCITWSATSGTITPEICTSSPAVRFAPNLKLGVIEVRIVPAPIVTAERGV